MADGQTAFADPDETASASTQPVGLSAYALLAPAFDELALLFFMTIMGGIALMLEGWWLTALNVAIPAVLMFTMARGALRSLRQSVATVWSPLVWMRAAIFFYGGFGTFTVLFGNDALRDYAEVFFVFYAGDILKYNVVVLAFTLTMLSACKLYLLVIGGRRSVTEIFNPQRSSIDLTVIGGLFVITGLAANLLFIVPYQFGFVNTTFPTLISEVAQAAYIGIFLSLVALARSRSPLLGVVVAIGVGLAFIGLLAFSKSSAVMPVVMMMLAYFYAKPSVTRLLVMAGTTLAVFFVSAPLVDHGRYLMQVRYGGIDAPAPPDERFDMLASYWDPRTLVAGDEEIDYASLRFSYVNVGSFVTSLRDQGQEGDTYANALAVFVPRALWPDKPVITETSRRLSYEATGNWNNSVAPGLAPEAYWNDGWFGVAVMGAIIGLIVSVWSVYSLAVQVAGAWYLFPVVLLGVRMGSRFDGFFVSDVLGPIAFGVAGHFVLSFANAAIAKRSAARAPAPA